MHLVRAGGFAGRLHRGQEQRHQNSNDGDHHQELDQGKRGPPIDEMLGT